jgi:hypothetical protein
VLLDAAGHDARFGLADGVAGHVAALADHHPAVHPDANREADAQLLFEVRAQLVDRLDERESGTDGAAAVILMRDRVAEKRDHTVAFRLRQRTFETLEDLAADLLELRHQLMENLGKVLAVHGLPADFRGDELDVHGRDGLALHDRPRGGCRGLGGAGAELPHPGDGRAELLADLQEEPLALPGLGVVLLDRFPTRRNELPRGQPFVTFPFARRENDRKDDHAVAAAAVEKRAHLDVVAVGGVEETLAHQHEGDVGRAQALPDRFIPRRPRFDALVGPELDILIALQTA